MEVSCPTCKKAIQWSSQSPFRPFCSKRCQLIDLGEWSNEQMAIPGDTQSQNEPAKQTDIEDVEAMLAKQKSHFFKEQE